jgi:hypothetical protein
LPVRDVDVAELGDLGDGPVAGAEVVLEQTAGGGSAYGLVVVLLAELARVRTHEVVELEAAGRGLQQQVGVDQLFEDRLRCRRIDIGERAGAVLIDVTARHQAQEAEHPLLLVAQVFVGQGEGRLQPPSVDDQLAESPFLGGQALVEVLDSPGRTVSQPGSGDPDGQR